MARKWETVRRKFAPEVEARIKKRVEEETRRLSLYQLREARNLTQVGLAAALNIQQGAVSKLERRTDMYISTLRSYIQAMGGDLQIRAVFPDSEVQISQFGDIEVKAKTVAG